MVRHFNDEAFNEQVRNAPTFGNQALIARCIRQVDDALRAVRPLFPLFIWNYEKVVVPEGYTWEDRCYASEEPLRKACAALIVLSHRMDLTEHAEYIEYTDVGSSSSHESRHRWSFELYVQNSKEVLKLLKRWERQSAEADDEEADRLGDEHFTVLEATLRGLYEQLRDTRGFYDTMAWQ